MAQSGNLVGNVGLAAGAGVGGVTDILTGGSGHNSAVAVAQRSNLVGNVGLAAGAGIGGEASVLAGGCGHNSAVAVTDGRDDLGIAFTAVAGVGNQAVLGAGGSHDVGLVDMLAGGGDGLGVAFAADTGVNGIALLHAGGLHGLSGVAVAQSGDLVSNVSLAADAGVGGVTVLGAGGSGGNSAVAVTQSGDHLGNGLAADAADLGLQAVLGAGGSHDVGLVDMLAGGGDDLGIGVGADGTGVDLAAVLCTGGRSLGAGVAVADGRDLLNGLGAAGTDGGDGAILGAGGSHGDGLKAVLVGSLLGLHKEGQPVIHGAHLGGVDHLELAVIQADGIVVAGAAAADRQDLLIVLGLHAPAVVDGAAAGLSHSQLGVGAAVGSAGGPQIGAGLGIVQEEVAAAGGGGPGQRQIVADDVGAVVIGLHLNGHGGGIAAHGEGADIGGIVAVVDQHIALTGGDGLGLAPDLAARHGNIGGLGLGSLGLGGLRLRSLGHSGLRDLGRLGLGGGMVTGHGDVQSITAGVDAGVGVGRVLDGILIEHHGHDGVAAGAGGGVGAGGGGLSVAGADVCKVQHHVLGVAAAVGADGHGAALGVVVIAGLVILVIVAEEVGNIHALCHFVDGGCPQIGMAVVVAVVQQGLVGHDQQGLALVQSGNVVLKPSDILLDHGGAVQAGVIAVIGAGVGHTQQIDVVVAVVVSAVDAVIACAVDQMAGLVQQRNAVLLNGVAVMVGPDIVDGDGGIAQGIMDVAGDGAGIAGILAAVLIDREGIAAAGDGGDGQTGVFQGTKEAVDVALLVIALAGVQVGENDGGIDGRIGCGQHIHRDQGEHHHENEHCRQNSLCVGCQFHCTFLLFFFLFGYGLFHTQDIVIAIWLPFHPQYRFVSKRF